jgi:hypothetical protein
LHWETLMGLHWETLMGLHSETLMGLHWETLMGLHWETLIGLHRETLMGLHWETLMGLHRETLMGLHRETLMGLHWETLMGLHWMAGRGCSGAAGTVAAVVYLTLLSQYVDALGGERSWVPLTKEQREQRRRESPNPLGMMASVPSRIGDIYRQALLQPRLLVVPAVAVGGWALNHAALPVHFDYGFALVRAHTEKVSFRRALRAKRKKGNCMGVFVFENKKAADICVFTSCGFSMVDTLYRLDAL